MFLTGLARAISRQENTRPIIIHADSAYTERIMQSGVMRDEAQIRAQKDLNHRLIALFADEGISAVGINGYQRRLIRRLGDGFVLDESQFERLPHPSVIILSCLVWDEEEAKVVPVELCELAKFLHQKLETDRLFVFNKSETWPADTGNKNRRNLPDDFKEKHIPAEFQNFDESLCLTTAHHFQNVPDLQKSIWID